MNTYRLSLEILASAAAGMAVLRVPIPPLLKTPERISPNVESSGFWLSHVQIMRVIAPLILVLPTDWFGRHADPRDSLRFALRAAAIGLLVALQRIGSRMARFVVVPNAAEGSK